MKSDLIHSIEKMYHFINYTVFIDIKKKFDDKPNCKYILILNHSKNKIKG